MTEEVLCKRFGHIEVVEASKEMREAALLRMELAEHPYEHAYDCTI